MEKTGAQIPPHILDDLCSRFILNMPDNYKEDTIRVFFEIELAHWFYIDFFVPENPDLKSLGVKEFAKQVFRHCPFLKGADNVDSSHQDWKAYKLSVPTYGAILVDPTMSYVLLVQGFSRSWGFPKGKINEGEEPVKCAVRELSEETGFDASALIKSELYVEHTVGDQYSRLYIIPDVPLETDFLPQTRNEIRSMQWFPIELLPMHKKDVTSSKALGCGPNSFFMVIPFIRQLKKWIYHRQTGTVMTTPKRKDKQRLEAEKAFAERSTREYQSMLASLESPNPASRQVDRQMKKYNKGRDNRTGSPGSHTKHRASPQYTLLDRSKRDEEMKKVSDIRRSLNLKPQDEKSKNPSFVPPETMPFKPVKAWTNFKFDIDNIMKEVFG